MKNRSIIFIIFCQFLLLSCDKKQDNQPEKTVTSTIQSKDIQDEVDEQIERQNIMNKLFDEADAQIERLPPEMFPQLPQKIIKYLHDGNYTIPQSVDTTLRKAILHNVIKGDFNKNGQIDWAVLCSSNNVSSIMIFWGGSIQHVSEIAKKSDRSYLQGIGNDKIGFSRAIDIADKKYIMNHYKSYDGPTPPNISHAGINDIFVHKTSYIHYYHQGEWLELQGAD